MVVVVVRVIGLLVVVKETAVARDSLPPFRFRFRVGNDLGLVKLSSISVSGGVSRVEVIEELSLSLSLSSSSCSSSSSVSTWLVLPW